MKKLLISSFVLLVAVCKAQFPQLINYQGVARNNTGAPLINQTIGVKFDIHELTAAGTVTFSEMQTLITNSLGLFSTQIGKVNNLAVCDWTKLQYFLEVSIDPNGGTSYTSLGTQQLASVPFALYAKTAGNATSYSSSPNVTITTGNIMDLTSTGVTAGSYGNAGTTRSQVPVLSVDSKGRITSASEYTANLNGDISGRLDSQYVSKLMGAPLSTLSPVSGQVLQFNGTNWQAGLPAGGPWAFTTGNIYPSGNANSDKVSIGQSGGSSLLTVNSTSNSLVSTVPVVDIKNNNPSYNSQGVLSVANYTGGGSALYVQNDVSAFSSDGITVNMSNPSSTSSGIRVTHVGGGRAGDFSTTSSSSTSDALFASSTSSAAFGLRAQNLNSSYGGALYSSNVNPAYTAQFLNSGGGGALVCNGASGSAIISSGNSGSGSALYGYNSGTITSASANGIYGLTYNPATNVAGTVGENTNAGAGVIGLNTNSATASVFAHGVKGETNNPAAQASGVYGHNFNVGAGVYGSNTFGTSSGNAHGVYGETYNPSISSVGVYGRNYGTGHGVYGLTNSSATNAAGVFGENGGPGYSVYGLKQGTANGNVARFDNTNSSNSADALFATTNGVGAAVHAAAGSLGSSALALLIENGHIKVIGPTIGVASTTVSNGFSAVTGATCVSCNDVRGVVSFTTSATGFATPNFADVVINFSKSYSVIPVVNLTPMSDMQNISYMVTNVSTTGFTIRVYRTSNTAGGSVSTQVPGSPAFKFSYIVIE